MTINSGWWIRQTPIKIQEVFNLMPRQVLPIVIKTEFPNSDQSRVIDVEWISKDNVPVTLSYKNSIYTEVGENQYRFQKMDICLFNASRYRSATVELYKIEEVYYSASKGNSK